MSPVLPKTVFVRPFVTQLSLVIGFSLFSYFVLQQFLFAQADVDMGQIEYNLIQAKENFRIGVNAFNYGFYNRAIVALEHSLSLNPESSGAIFWLGRSYYANGYVRLGLEQWKSLIDENQATSSLRSFYDTLDYRYRLVSRRSSVDEYSLFMKLQSRKRGTKRNMYFIGPTSARASLDRDKIYIVDYRDSKVVAVDASGATKFLFRGSIQKVYDRPFDILLRPKGQGFILSQEGSHSLLFCDENGFPFKEVGEKGNGFGQFLGPQHLTDSGDGYFYVTDWGNRRIVKLDYNGNFIFTFGSANERFLGLEGPTGIMIRNNKMYVADTLQQKIFIFNQEGIYLETFINSGLKSPESLQLTKEGNMLIADGNEIKLYDFNENKLKTIYTSEKNRRYVDIGYDRNLNIIAVDFDNQRIDFITPINNLYTDMFVQINRVLTSQYPKVDIDLLVQDREGNPIVGLSKENFQVIESNKRQNSDLIYTSVNDQSVAIAIILGSNLGFHHDAIREVANNVIQRNGEARDDSFVLVQGGKIPRILSTSIADLAENFTDYIGLEPNGSPEANFDISLRFALDSLVQSRQRKVIVFFSGDTDKIATETYNISDLKSYLQLENANMYSVLSKGNKVISYLVDNTNGRVYNNSSVRNFDTDLQENRDALTGHYTLSFRSIAYTDLARRYLPIEVLVRYVRRSGKDELGYFAPLSSINANR